MEWGSLGSEGLGGRFDGVRILPGGLDCGSRIVHMDGCVRRFFSLVVYDGSGS